MKTNQSLAIMKALADKSRLAIINSLLENTQYVEELAKRHDLAPSTVSFHLRKLEQAGLVTSRKEQYYVVIQANDEIFNTTLREIVTTYPVSREHQDNRMVEYRKKVLETFFRYGRLEKLPAQHKKRLIVLEQFALRFKQGRRYDEQEVTELILPVFDDYCTVRRLLVDEGLLRRDGNSYWRDWDPGELTGKLPWPSPEKKEAGVEEKRKDRTEIKRVYKQNRPDIGVYQIRNKANGRIYVATSQNLEGTRNSRIFQLRMGKAVFSRELQKDLDEFGADSFEFSVLEVLDRAEQADTIERTLAERELHWLKSLQPFDERGYNSAKAYQRNRARLKKQQETDPAR
ncbi:MAG: metalloregulator ArsR/SmtB family transcription factor [Geobacteraceae bacterium]